MKFTDGIPAVFWDGSPGEGTLGLSDTTVYGTRDQFHVVPWLVAPLPAGAMWLVDAIQATNHSAANAYWSASVWTNTGLDRSQLVTPNRAYFNFAWGLLLYPGESVVMDVNYTLVRQASLLFTVDTPGAGATANPANLPVIKSFNYLGVGRTVDFTVQPPTVPGNPPPAPYRVTVTLIAPYNPGDAFLSVASVPLAVLTGSTGTSIQDPGLWAGAWPGSNYNPVGSSGQDGVPAAISMAFTGRVLA